MKIWEICGGISKFEQIEKAAWRMVQDQSRSTTRKLVDTPEEQEVLEEMIEKNKPKLKHYGDENAFRKLHYLLYTPFRYPPLKQGSRFGRAHERNLLYSSFEIETAMYEKAFHRLIFMRGSEGNIGGKPVSYTIFKFQVSTKKGIDLCKKPFDTYQEQISSLRSYKDSQVLGSAMRQEGVEAFICYSARRKSGKNLNVFTPNAFGNNKFIEKTYQTWECYSTKEVIEFYPKQMTNKNSVIFNLEDFCINGEFPL